MSADPHNGVMERQLIETSAVSKLFSTRSRECMRHVMGLLDAAVLQLDQREHTAHATLLEAASLLKEQFDAQGMGEAFDGRERLLASQAPRPIAHFDASYALRNAEACSPNAFSSHPLDQFRLRRALDYVSSNIDDDITPADLAGIAGYSPSHFARKFTLAMGVSPHRYVSRLRLERAMAQLATGKVRLVEIALNAHFSSQASFTRAFHRATGLTPKEYQRRRLQSQVAGGFRRHQTMAVVDSTSRGLGTSKSGEETHKCGKDKNALEYSPPRSDLTAAGT
jgi:AraC-like DNA-binding protein